MNLCILIGKIISEIKYEFIVKNDKIAIEGKIDSKMEVIATEITII